MSRFQGFVYRLLLLWLGNDLQVNHRPDWLKGLELDFFHKDFRLGIEVDGQQHYQFTPALQTSQAQFVSQVARDGCKELLCAKQRIRFVRVWPRYQFVHKLRADLRSLGGLRGKWLRRSDHRLESEIANYCAHYGFQAPDRFSFSRHINNPSAAKKRSRFEKATWLQRDQLDQQICGRY